MAGVVAAMTSLPDAAPIYLDDLPMHTEWPGRILNEVDGPIPERDVEKIRLEDDAGNYQPLIEFLREAGSEDPVQIKEKQNLGTWDFSDSEKSDVARPVGTRMTPVTCWQEQLPIAERRLPDTQPLQLRCRVGPQAGGISGRHQPWTSCPSLVRRRQDHRRFVQGTPTISCRNAKRVVYGGRDRPFDRESGVPGVKLVL